ncbi:hypothetical protein D9M73_144580 [compost metagenome]
MQQVGIHRVRGFLLAVTLDRDRVLFGVIHQLFTGQQVPFAPRCDHFYAWLQGVGAQFETNLVVTLAGGAVGNGIGAGFVGDFDQALGDQRTGDGGTQQVLAFIDGVGAEHREYEVANEFFAQVIDVDFLDAQCLSLGAGRFDLFALPQIGSESHHFTVVGILQPLENHRSIKAAGIRQYDLFYVRHAITPRGCTESRRFYRPCRKNYSGATACDDKATGTVDSATDGRTSGLDRRLASIRLRRRGCWCFRGFF